MGLSCSLEACGPYDSLSHGPGLGHRERPTQLMPESHSLQSLNNTDTLRFWVGMGGTHPTPSSLKHQHHHSFSKDSLMSGWPFPRINIVTIGFEVLKVVCGVIKAVCGGWAGVGWGVVLQGRETPEVQSRQLCSPSARRPLLVMTRAVHQKAPPRHCSEWASVLKADREDKSDVI